MSNELVNTKDNKGRETFCLPPSFTIDTSLQYRPIIAPSTAAFDIGPVIISSSKDFLVGTVKIKDLINTDRPLYISNVRIPSKIIKEEVKNKCKKLSVSPDCLSLYNIPLLVSRDAKALICTDRACISTSLESEVIPLVDIETLQRVGSKVLLNYMVLGTSLRTKTLNIQNLDKEVINIVPPFLQRRKNLIIYLHRKITDLLKHTEGPTIKIISK